jgi:hypothetical protein
MYGLPEFQGVQRSGKVFARDREEVPAGASFINRHFGQKVFGQNVFGQK